MKLTDKLVAYLRSTKEEVRKVSWPSRQDTFRYSLLVIGASVAIALFFATLDYGFTQLWDYIAQQRGNVTRTTETPIQQVPVTVPSTNSNTNSAPVLDLGEIKTEPINVNAAPAPKK